MKRYYNKKWFIISSILLIFIMMFSIKVYAANEPFTIESESADVVLNGSKWLSYTGGTGTITWKSSDESIATVENGIVKGHKIGTVTITAIRGEETDTCTVNVIYRSIKDT